VFHGAFCYAVFEKMPVCEALEFSNATAALNSTALGARGGIGARADAADLMRRGQRRRHTGFAARAGRS
jgi:sugar/nucleoside kinase (ribokinase family)